MTNNKQAAAKNRVPMELLPPNVLVHVAAVLAHGASDYGAWNWRDENVSMRTYIGATMRHLMAFSDGEDNDQKTGKSHIAHAIASLMILLDAVDLGIVKDDRSKSGNVPHLLSQFQEAQV